MKYLLLVYIDPELLEQATAEQYDGEMRHCIRHADTLATQGTLLGFNKLESPAQARTVRIREGRTSVFDGPFAETKELVAGYWLWEVKDMDEAVAWVKRCPNPMPGPSEIEIRPVYEIEDFGEALTPAAAEIHDRVRDKLESN